MDKSFNSWREPFYFLRDHPQWQVKYPLGPVSFDIFCKVCNKVILENINDPFEELKDHIKLAH